MDIDVLRYIGAVTRSVEAREHEGHPARVVVATCTYDTTLADLWDAITNADRIPRWFLPISGDLRVGGRYQLQGNASGQITTCEPPHALAVTWEFAKQVTWVDVRLTSLSDGGAQLRLEHIVPVDDHWNQYGAGAVGVGLERHVAGSAGLAPEQAVEWLASPNGKDFMRQSSDDWRRAAVAGGTEPAAAREQARQTNIAYMGE